MLDAYALLGAARLDRLGERRLGVGSQKDKNRAMHVERASEPFDIGPAMSRSKAA